MKNLPIVNETIHLFDNIALIFDIDFVMYNRIVKEMMIEFEINVLEHFEILI